MPRLRQVSKAEATSPIVKSTYQLLFGDKDPVEVPGTNTGTPGDWWTVFALIPEILEHCINGFLLYNSPKRKLDPKLRELGQARAGYNCQSQFVYSQHAKSMRGLGISDEKIKAICYWQSAGCFNDKERLLLSYCDYLCFDYGRVPDEFFNELKNAFSDEEILEFTYFTSLYIMHSIMSRALKTEFDDRKDPIEEVGPKDAHPWDIV
jgi:alkylhydroperoxidase family enzyme